MSSCPPISLQLPAHEYQRLMQSGQLTSELLVTAFLDQTDRHNTNGLKLKAIISACPRDIALAQATTLDQERKAGKIRSKLHGVPIVLKDAIVTHPSLGMGSSAGSSAIASLTATRNATVVDRLLDAGVIILGKANLTEFCGMKSDNTPMGWSAHGGQTLSAYRRPDLKEEDQPISAGSSSGSAVSISAGFAPLAIGTETGGSNVFPASASGLYALTLPHGSVPVDGVCRISESYDRMGLMARDPEDIAALAHVLLGQDRTSGEQQQEEDGVLKGPESFALKGLSIGILDSEWGTDPAAKWKWGCNEVKSEYASAASRLAQLGARVVFPLEDPPSPSVMQYEGEGAHSISYYEFPTVLKSFIATNFDPEPSLTYLADLISWNEAHASIAMPKPYTTQTELQASLSSRMDPATHLIASTALRRIAREEGLSKLMREQDLDIVLSASDASLISFSACAGWPVATLPVGNLTKNDQPWGFFALARDGERELLMKLMRGFRGGFKRPRGPTRPFTE
ncbi:unnamed protein product [Discula destructiva]